MRIGHVSEGDDRRCNEKVIQFKKWYGANFNCLDVVISSQRTRHPDPPPTASNRTGLRSAQSLSIAVPRTYSSLGDRAFAVAMVPPAWNNLPSHIRHNSSTDVFSNNLKSYLFTLHSNCRLLPLFLCALFSRSALSLCLSHLRRLNLAWLGWSIDWLMQSDSRKIISPAFAIMDVEHKVGRPHREWTDDIKDWTALHDTEPNGSR